MHSISPTPRRELARPLSLIIAAACTAFALVAEPASAHGPAVVKARIVDVDAANEQAESAQTLTLSLLEAHGRLSAASTLKSRNARQAALQSIAQQRSDALKRLIDHDKCNERRQPAIRRGS